MAHKLIESEIDDDTADNQWKIYKIKVCVEPQGHAQKICRSDFRIFFVDQKVSANSQWQKEKYEYVRIKQQNRILRKMYSYISYSESTILSNEFQKTHLHGYIAPYKCVLPIIGYFLVFSQPEGIR